MDKKLILGILIVALVFCGCARQSAKENTTSQNTIPIPPPSIPASVSTPTSTSAPSATPLPRVVRPAIRSVDLVVFQSPRNGAWFNVGLDSLPETQQTTAASFEIKDTTVENRRNGQIASTLLAGYLFAEWNISSSAFDKYDHTIGAFFIRSLGMPFIDYVNNRALTRWNGTSTNIPDIRGIIELCNKRNIPVFVQANYSDYIPGPAGTGVESLQKTDTTANLVFFLRDLRTQGIHVDGITFGDEIGDNSGYGDLKPTLFNSDLIGRFITFASTLKSEFPELKIYAFDSYISATRGQVSMYLDYLQKIRQAEIKEGKNLLDGYIFRESYVYIDENGNLLPSQLVLDDTESLYRDTPVYRFDVTGITHPNPDRDYLHTVIARTMEIFGRPLDIGITEYLPAGPVQINETDTSRYADMDFIIHYSDMVGIYAELGLDYISTIMFGNSVNMHKAYFDREDNWGVNYPIHEQLAQYFAGEILSIERSIDYDHLKVKVYATRKDKNYFIMILNKDVGSESVIRVTLPGQLDLILRLPCRSYTSLVINEDEIVISGIGN